MKIGMLSFAHLHAESYIQNLLKHPDVEVIGIADESPNRGEYFAKEFGVYLFDSYNQLLATNPDAVIVCSENSKHRPLVEMAAREGAHVLCEKPLATNLEDARAIVEVCEKAGVTLMTAFPMRFSPAVGQVKARMDAGEFGQVYCFATRNQGPLPIKHRIWFADKALAGGGALTDHVVHLLDILRWYLRSEVVEVYAGMNHIFHPDDIDVETGGLVMLTFENGVFATIDSSWSRPTIAPLWGGLTFEIEVITERGAVLVDAFSQAVTVFRQDISRPDWEYFGTDFNQSMINEFISAIQENRQPLITGWDGYKAVEVVAAAYKSVETGQPVQLPFEN